MINVANIYDPVKSHNTNCGTEDYFGTIEIAWGDSP
jgi:hypothetical protein